MIIQLACAFFAGFFAYLCKAYYDAVIEWNKNFINTITDLNKDITEDVERNKAEINQIERKSKNELDQIIRTQNHMYELIRNLAEKQQSKPKDKK